MLVIEYAPEESEYNKSFLYIEVLIGISDYISTHFPHLALTFVGIKRSCWNLVDKSDLESDVRKGV